MLITIRFACPCFVRRPLKIRATAVANNYNLHYTIRDRVGE